MSVFVYKHPTISYSVESFVVVVVVGGAGLLKSMFPFRVAHANAHADRVYTCESIWSSDSCDLEIFHLCNGFYYR